LLESRNCNLNLNIIILSFINFQESASEKDNVERNKNKRSRQKTYRKKENYDITSVLREASQSIKNLCQRRKATEDEKIKATTNFVRAGN